MPQQRKWKGTIIQDRKTFHLVGVFENLKIAVIQKRRLMRNGREVRLRGRAKRWYRPHPVTGKKGRYAVYCWPEEKKEQQGA